MQGCDTDHHGRNLEEFNRNQYDMTNISRALYRQQLFTAVVGQLCKGQQHIQDWVTIWISFGARETETPWKKEADLGGLILI